MRVLIASVPHPAHLYIAVPYAQAFQLAGHEVVFGTMPGGDADAVAAGLPAVSFGEPTPLSLANWKRLGLLPDQEKRQRYTEVLGLNEDEQDWWDTYYQYYAFNARFFLQREPRADIDGLIEFARKWKPDLVLWDAWFPLGGIVARACGAPHARILIGPDYSGWAHKVLAERGGPETDALGGEPLLEALRPVAERYGVPLDDDLVLGARSLDPLPPARSLTPGPDTLPVRWITYNGGAVKPEWLHTPPAKPRVAVTLGLSVRLWQRGGDPRLTKVLEALGELDVEVIATCDEEQLKQVPRLPDNVRVVEYVPLSQLLPTCSAVVHHGSSGAFLSSIAAGVPQLVFHTDEKLRQIFSGEGDAISVTNADRDTDSWLSGYIAERGAGAALNHQTDSVTEIRATIAKVLGDPSHRAAALELQREWRSRPGPADIAVELEKLTATEG
ncbi:nucleotide disphospho-sugar-binding domain-containing protein [Actinomadura flavalba]|uniref:nucleotide disphospho-sugar-binding domain-containing protein n=1 Tax=Actinomadura flavalba TaxID=1120938 RepID=UPI000376A1B6|nr:nucleotide disphospho-sugar-binding domain-containing protein [Actinomadura flavalba]